jgi:hypothetical protein
MPRRRGSRRLPSASSASRRRPRRWSCNRPGCSSNRVRRVPRVHQVLRVHWLQQACSRQRWERVYPLAFRIPRCARGSSTTMSRRPSGRLRACAAFGSTRYLPRASRPPRPAARRSRCARPTGTWSSARMAAGQRQRASRPRPRRSRHRPSRRSRTTDPDGSPRRFAARRAERDAVPLSELQLVTYYAKPARHSLGGWSRATSAKREELTR